MSTASGAEFPLTRHRVLPFPFDPRMTRENGPDMEPIEPTPSQARLVCADLQLDEHDKVTEVADV